MRGKALRPEPPWYNSLAYPGEIAMAARIKKSNPDTLPPPAGAYSHVARVSAGELLFIAGQVP
jgi:hypothetical protein